MKKFFSIIIFLFCLPLSLLAHGESPELYIIIGYVFLIPIGIGIIEALFLKKMFEVKSKITLRSTALSLTITITGYLVAFYTVDSIIIGSSEIVTAAIIIFILSIIQLLLKSFLYNRLLIKNNDDLLKLGKLILFETIMVNLVFFLAIWITI
jgi:hypothetical protein